MLVAQISDTHIAGRGQLTCGIAPMADNLARCVQSINELSMRPDLVLLSGDVTQSATLEEAEHAAGILRRLQCPFYIVPGNHDDREVLWQVFGNTACPSREDGFICYALGEYPLRIIGLDVVREGAAGGALCEGRARWLQRALEEGDGRPTILFMHHPPLAFGVPETDQDGFEGAARLGRIVADHPEIERILCGHIHLAAQARWNGTMVTTAPSTGMRLTLDLSQSAPSRFVLCDPAYLLHYLTPQGALVTHQVQLDNAAGPHDFT